MKVFSSALSLLLVLVLMVSMVPVSFATQGEATNAEGYIPTDPYAYRYDAEGDDYEGPKYQYFSPYAGHYTYNDLIEEYTGSDPIFSYCVYNSVTGTVIPAYSTDAFVPAVSDTAYCRANPEDSSSMIREPMVLRGIMQEGFYLPAVEGETEEEHNIRVNAKLESLRQATGISDLTVGEAVAATQMAIWKAAHGPDLTFDSMVSHVVTGSNSDLVQYFDLCNREVEEGHFTTDANGAITEDSKAYIAQRIEMLYNYLLAVETVTNDDSMLSEESFGGVFERKTVRNTDGTYDIHMSVYTKVDLAPEDHLTLTAAVDGTYYASAELVDGHNSHELVIKNVPAEILINKETGEIKTVTVAIDGEQTVSGVICLQAKSGSETSRTMVAMDSSRIPVHAEISIYLQRLNMTLGLGLGHSLNLESNIGINYVIPAQNLADYTRYELLCYAEGVEEPYVIQPQMKGEYVYFTFDEFTALNMNDTVEAVLEAWRGMKGNDYHLGRYSIATYAYTMMERENMPAKVKSLCANLLRYGATAQVFKGYKTESLVDERMTEAQRAYLKDLDSVEFGQPHTILPDPENPTVTWAGRTMALESTIALKQVINTSAYSGDPTALELRVSYTDVKGEEKSITLHPTVFDEERHLYAFTVTQLNAADLRSVLTCQVFAEGEAVSQTMVYSADSYGNNKTGTLLELCKAMFAYVDSARAFFAE